jgi:HK97 family phage major capsid protein
MKLHARDKRKWFAAHFGRQYFQSNPLQVPGMALGLLVPIVVVALVALIAFGHWDHSGMIMAAGPISLKLLRQKKADLTKEAGAILDAAGDGGLTADQKTQYDSIKSKLDANNELLVLGEEQQERERQVELMAKPIAGRTEVLPPGSDQDPRGGFKDHREFLSAVMDAGMGRRVDSRLLRFQATQGSDEQQTGSDPYGGFLIPQGIAPGVLTLPAEEDPITPRQIPMEVPSLFINARVDKDHSSSVSGGLVVTRRPETVDGTASRIQFEQIHMIAHELFGLAHASESLLQDSPQSFIAILTAGFQDEFRSNRINERLNGTGAGEFLGIMNSPCLIQVSKESAQSADTILTQNIDKMIARCWRYGQAIWHANHNTRPQLAGLFRLIGTTGGSVVDYFQPGKGPNGSDLLAGRPIYFTEYCKTLGDKGDLVLSQWSEYLEGTYQGMQQAESIHVRFAANERSFKFWLRNDGKPWWTSALTPKNGDTLSPFVTLQAR